MHRNNSYIVSNTTITSKPTSKAKEIPYYFVDYETANQMSERMYNNSNYVGSQLITGTQWDVMLNYISDEKDKSVENASDDEKYTDLKTNCDWGNYNNIDLENCDGKYCTFDPTTCSMKSLWLNNTKKSNKHEENDRILLTTGSTEQVKKKNLYDVAGNLWEWTQEEAYTTEYSEIIYVRRGGSFYHKYDSNPACKRGSNEYNYANFDRGFRVTLYIK